MTDVNDFTDYGEPCGCGHSNRKHYPRACSGTRKELDRAALPAPVYNDEGNPFEWPTNWPPVDDCPYVDVPCTCPGFSPAEPDPPEDWS